MDVTQKRADGLMREYDITLTAAQINQRVDARIASLATEINMPGFRPGRVPANIVKSRYGKQVLSEVLQAALDEATRTIIDDNALRVATTPDLQVTPYEEGGDMKATVKLEIMPEIETIDLAKLTIDRLVVDITERDIDAVMQSMAEDNRPTKPIAKPRAVRAGDIVLIDFVGRIDGKAFDGGTAEGHKLTIGSNSFIPGFEDGLIGAMPESTHDVKITFPDDYSPEHLAGQAAIFEVRVHEIHEPGDAKIDDELAKHYGIENVDALRAAMRAQMARQHATAVRTKVKTSLLDALDSTLGEFDIPPSLVAQEYNSICHAMNPHEHTEQDPDHSCDDGMSKDDKAEADMLARRRVRLGMALTDIGRQHNIQITEEEKTQAIYAEAQRYPGQQQQVLDYFRNNPSAAEQLAGPVFEDKVVDYILEIAKVNDHVVSRDELYEIDDFPKSAAKKATKKAAKASPSKKKAAKKTSKAKSKKD